MTVTRMLAVHVTLIVRVRARSQPVVMVTIVRKQSSVTMVTEMLVVAAMLLVRQRARVPPVVMGSRAKNLKLAMMVS